MTWSDVINLGADQVRMKDPRDAHRQTATVDHLLHRFFTDRENERYELQVLADEVGMGKTFVALAAAFAILEQRREGKAQTDACPHVLVLVPNNDALFRKWVREAKEFVHRCVAPEQRDSVHARFRMTTAERLDELAAALCHRNGPELVLAKVSALGGKVAHFDDKARFVLATAFRIWGTAFRLDARERLLRGGGRWNWPTDPKAFAEWDDDELESKTRLKLGPLTRALERILRGDEGDKLLALCRECATPYRREREDDVAKLRKKAVELYKAAAMARVTRSIPLVIVDEAHNWKNGPSKGSNGYRDFEKLIAPKAQRLLLLTATPFQLRPEELTELLKCSDKMGLDDERLKQLGQFREKDVAAVLEASRRASQGFAKAWTRLPSTTTPQHLLDIWNDSRVVETRGVLRDLADQHGALKDGEIDAALDRGAQNVDPLLRDFFKHALLLYANNRDLGQELGRLVVRHRRRTEHRLVRVGTEVKDLPERVAARPDARVLHPGPGIDVRGKGELPHYLLMRATAELKGTGHHAALGSSLTGCYSTLFDSAESQLFSKADTGPARQYIEVLRSLVGHEAADAEHPKLAAVVADTVERWKRGEKTLIFAFRSNTARRLTEIIKREVERLTEQQKQEVFDGETGLTVLRQRITARNRDLIPIVLDRILWSSLWAPPDGERAFGPDDLRPAREDYDEIARLALLFSVDLTDKLVDRVFLQRAVECAQARRLRKASRRGGRYRTFLDAVADDSWVALPYGGITADTAEDVAALVDERGVHADYEQGDAPRSSVVKQLAEELLQRDVAARRSKQTSILQTAFSGPSLWLGVEPMDLALQRWHLHNADEDVQDQRYFHEQAWKLTWNKKELDFRTRALAFQAVRRAALRESLLVRLLPSAQQLEDDGWSQLLAQRISAPLYPGGESVLRRLGIFLEDLAGASGAIDKPEDPRGAIYDTTRARGSAVTLVSGDSDIAARTRAFMGFNSPLLPEVLVCTSVGQEGIDLHRHCRHVVHYDLAWNPATLEQRTGRIDRIGCAALRERELDARMSQESRSYLEVDVPYLAGTYDERMFEELRLRAQTFEVLTGGDLATENADGLTDHGDEDQGKERGLELLTLPAEIVSALRVDLEVWREGAT